MAHLAIRAGSARSEVGVEAVTVRGLQEQHKEALCGREHCRYLQGRRAAIVEPFDGLPSVLWLLL